MFVLTTMKRGSPYVPYFTARTMAETQAGRISAKIHAGTTGGIVSCCNDVVHELTCV